MKEQIKSLCKEGKSNKEIMSILNITNPLICYYKRQLGIKRIKKVYPIGKRKERLERTKLSPEQLTQAILKYQRKKENSTRTKHEFSILFDDLVWNKVCPILGLELDYFSTKASPNSVSFDRINSSLGYIKGNVQIISWRANNLKSNGTKEEFKLILDYFDSL